MTHFGSLHRLRAPRPHVRALPEGLDRELDGAEIASLCAEAYGGEPAYDAWALRWPPTPEEIRSGFLPQR